jgi:hypothetical protein
MDTHIDYVLEYLGHARINSIKKSLTWNVSSLHMVVNLHPCWSFAQSQLPHFKIPPLPLPPLTYPLPSSHQHSIYLHKDDIDKPNSSSVRHRYTAFLII